MGKKKLRSKYTSKGRGDGQSWDLTKQCRREKSFADKLIAKYDAWARGDNPWLTVENPISTQTNKRFVRVRANQYLGNPKDCWSMQNLTKKKEDKVTNVIEATTN